MATAYHSSPGLLELDRAGRCADEEHTEVLLPDRAGEAAFRSRRPSEHNKSPVREVMRSKVFDKPQMHCSVGLQSCPSSSVPQIPWYFNGLTC